MQEGDQQRRIPWRVINAFYPQVKERKLHKGEKKYFDDTSMWSKLYMSDLEDEIANIPTDFIFINHIGDVKKEDKQETYEQFLTYFRIIKEEVGSTQNIFNLLEHLDIYAGYLQENEDKERLLGVCDEGIQTIDELLNIYEANNFYEAITTTLESKAKFYCLKGEAQGNQRTLEEGLYAIERIRSINNDNLTPHQHNTEGELFAYLAAMHQGELQAAYVEKSMNAEEKALMQVVDEDFLINYSELFSLVEESVSLPFDKKMRFRERGQEFMKYLQNEHVNNQIVGYYAEDFFDEDDDEGFEF